MQIRPRRIFVDAWERSAQQQSAEGALRSPCGRRRVFDLVPVPGTVCRFGGWHCMGCGWGASCLNTASLN